MNHGLLCELAVGWLNSRCNVALSGISSTREIPDAIGWSTGGRMYGSIVVECKVSLSDFHANKTKEHGNRLGNWRFFLTPRGLVTPEKVQAVYPGHGLLQPCGRGLRLIGAAEHRADPDQAQEIRLLQFALLHAKENLLYTGATVDLNTLTKHPLTNLKNAAWPKDRSFCMGVSYPIPQFTFNIGEAK